MTRSHPLLSLLLAAGLGLSLAGCTDDTATREAAGAVGFTDIKVEGYSIFGCGQDDAFHTSFSARGADGRCVTGVVCSGWLKGATLRVTGAKACPRLPAAQGGR